MTHPKLASRAIGAFLALVVLEGCATPTDPFTVARPTVAAITLDTARVRSQGILLASLHIQLDEFPDADTKLQVQVTTDRGQVRETYGPAERIIVGMKPGHSITELDPLLSSIRAHAFLTLLGGTAVALWVEPPPTARGAVFRASMWPGVLFAEPSVDFTPAVVVPAPAPTELPRLVLWIPVRTGVAPDPAWYLTIESGETMTVSYTQPDGSQVSALITWP
jgi:hypothetical protein